MPTARTLFVDQPDSLPASTTVTRAAFRSRPGIATAGAVFAGLVAIAFLIGFAGSPGDRPFLAIMFESEHRQRCIDTRRCAAPRAEADVTAPDMRSREIDRVRQAIWPLP